MKRVSDLTLTSASCEKACVQELRGCMEQQKSVEVSRMEVMRTMIGRERQRVGGPSPVSGGWVRTQTNQGYRRLGLDWPKSVN